MSKEISRNFSTALSNADICHQVELFPAKRAEEQLKNQHYDGIVVKVTAFQKKFSQPLIRIKPAVAKASGVLISRQAGFQNIEDLKEGSLGILRGWLWMEKLSRKHKNTIRLSSRKKLFRMLSEKKLDAILGLEFWQSNLEAKNYSFNKVIDLSGYVYLKASFGEFEKKISSAISDFYKSGHVFLNQNQPGS